MAGGWIAGHLRLWMVFDEPKGLCSQVCGWKLVAGGWVAGHLRLWIVFDDPEKLGVTSLWLVAGFKDP